MQVLSSPAAPYSLDQAALIRQAAFDLLARREHSRQGLILKLGRRFARRAELMITQDHIESVVTTMAEQGLQSDQRYQDTFIHSRIKLGYGPLRIAQELRQKGVAPEELTAMLQSHDVSWHEQARLVKEKKFGKVRAADQKTKARQMRFLQYRGFGMEHIKFALGV